MLFFEAFIVYESNPVKRVLFFLWEDIMKNLISNFIEGVLALFLQFFNFLLTLLDYESLANASIQSGDDPIYGYFLVAIFAIILIAISGYLLVIGMIRLFRYLYIKEMQWQRIQRLQKLKEKRREGFAEAK